MAGSLTCKLPLSYATPTKVAAATVMVSAAVAAAYPCIMMLRFFPNT
jgi:hypothetical protein